MSTIRTQTHHITYDPEWTVELQNYQHKVITILQNSIPTEERYMWLNDFVHALTWEYNRFRMFLDTEHDLDKLLGYGKNKKRKKKKVKIKSRLKLPL